MRHFGTFLLHTWVETSPTFAYITNGRFQFNKIEKAKTEFGKSVENEIPWNAFEQWRT